MPLIFAGASRSSDLTRTTAEGLTLLEVHCVEDLEPDMTSKIRVAMRMAGSCSLPPRFSRNQPSYGSRPAFKRPTMYLAKRSLLRVPSSLPKMSRTRLEDPEKVRPSHTPAETADQHCQRDSRSSPVTF